MTKVAKLKPKTSFDMKHETYARMYDIVAGSKQYVGFHQEYQSGERSRGGLNENQLGELLNSILYKEPMEIGRDVKALQGEIAQIDLDLLVTAYLSQGKVDLALELIRDSSLYLTKIDQGDKTSEQLTSVTMDRLFDPSIQQGNNLFDVAHIVLEGIKGDQLYREMRDSITKWSEEYRNAVKRQLIHLETRLGKKV